MVKLFSNFYIHYIKFVLLHFSHFYHLAVLISGSLLHNVFSAVSCSCMLKNMGLFSSFYKNDSSFGCYPLQPPSIKSCHLFLVMYMLVCVFAFPVMFLLWYRINTHSSYVFHVLPLHSHKLYILYPIPVYYFYVLLHMHFSSVVSPVIIVYLS